MENKKKKKHGFIIVLAFLFIIFLSLYFSQASGYYEYNQYNKKIITEEAMEKFESDVSKGKDIKIEDYLDDIYKDYSNGASKLGLKTSKMIENFMTSGIKRTFRILGKLFID